ncbi:hypothetical protein [Bacillus vallismortis]|uniref:hypothetical protein n=1 Tax=Bacillus vallismortis TaxID=72361 RepID=UPI00227F0466|nr:hypothetical protein [Bacillus vallismortis]MCY8309932.1 hypothetical protein [Bacillus vallismortis]MCY8598039.1 hypothetical protein [Bacillus vallismortis]
MKVYKSLTVGILSLSLVFSGITSAFAAEKKDDNRLNIVTSESLDPNASIENLMIYHTTGLNSDSSNVLKNAADVQATWDGQFKSDYTIPAYVVASAASGGMYHITRYLTATLNLGPAAAAAFTSMVTGYVASKGDIRLVSTEKYKWIVRYTKAKYQATTKIYKNGKYKTTKTKTWISEADSNIDSVE